MKRGLSGGVRVVVNGDPGLFAGTGCRVENPRVKLNGVRPSLPKASVATPSIAYDSSQNISWTCTARFLSALVPTSVMELVQISLSSMGGVRLGSFGGRGRNGLLGCGKDRFSGFISLGSDKME